MSAVRLATICARGGSQGVPGKNVREFLGKPLLVHSIEHAREAELFDRIVVSSDSPAILELAEAAGVDAAIQRPAELATHTIGKVPAIRHAAEEARRRWGPFAVVTDLDVTSPLRDAGDIVAAVGLLESDPDATNVITAAPAARSPWFNMVSVDGSGVVDVVMKGGPAVLRRQDAPECYDMNASIYVWRWDALFAMERLFGAGTRLHVMPRERSHDIDEEVDLIICEALARWQRRVQG